MKLFIAFGSILLLSVFLIFIATNSIDNILHYKNLNSSIDNLSIELTQVNLHAKDFIHHGFKEPKFQEEGVNADLEGFEQSYTAISSILKQLQTEEAFTSSQSTNTFISVQEELEDYQASFLKLVDVLKQRGFKDYGVEGELRSAIHHVENSGFDFDMAKMLMLRRHEKDFFLRKDLKYLSKFNSDVNEFYQSVKAVDTKGSIEHFMLQGRALQNIKEYKDKFNLIVGLEKTIGLSDNQGLKGQMAMAYNSLKPQLLELGEQIKATNKRLIDRSLTILFVIFVLQLLVGVLLVLVYSGLISKAINEVKSAMVSLAEGHFPEPVPVRTGDEIGDTKAALNGLIERIKAAVGFANALGNGELDKEYEKAYSSDVLAKSIMSMQQKLVLAEKQQSRINWVNKGLAQFTEILKNESDDLKLLGDNIIKNMVKYLEANQGAVYLYNENTRTARRLSTYAYGRKKYEDHEIEEGEGLVGQCLIEKETTWITKVPDGYTRITSGLGEATPAFVLVVPLKIRDTFVGVVELASFNLLDNYEIQFVEKVSENIANILVSKQIADRTKSLLAESQEKAEQLAAQEEEMRQNTEELQATQEEMMRQKEELESKIVLLKKEAKTNDQKMKALESQIKLKEEIETLHKLESQMNQM